MDPLSCSVYNVLHHLPLCPNFMSCHPPACPISLPQAGLCISSNGPHSSSSPFLYLCYSCFLEFVSIHPHYHSFLVLLFLSTITKLYKCLKYPGITLGRNIIHTRCASKLQLRQHPLQTLSSSLILQKPVRLPSSLVLYYRGYQAPL